MAAAAFLKEIHGGVTLNQTETVIRTNPLEGGSRILDGANTSVQSGEKDASGVMVSPIEASRFNVSNPQEREAMMKHLDDFGFAVVASVADPSECERLRGLMWDFLESVPDSKVRRDDPDTWDGKGWIPSSANGIISGHGFAHSDFMWQTRLLPKVKQAFAEIWGTEDLLVSFDTGNAFRPWRRNPNWLTDSGWWHTDQNSLLPDRQGRCCVQGLVTLLDASPETGGLCVIPGSHQLHDAFCSRSEVAKVSGDFVPVPEEDELLSLGGRQICCKAGDLVLWDSRTVHCNTPATMSLVANSLRDQPHSANQDRSLIRQVAYVCMAPFARAHPDTIESRKRAFTKNVQTSHWPDVYSAPNQVNALLEDNDPEVAVPEQRALIGFRT